MRYEDHRTAAAPPRQWCAPPPPLPRRNITSYSLTTISTLGNSLVDVKSIIRCAIAWTTTYTRETTTNVIIFEQFNFYNNTKRKWCQNFPICPQTTRSQRIIPCIIAQCEPYRSYTCMNLNWILFVYKHKHVFNSCSSPLHCAERSADIHSTTHIVMSMWHAVAFTRWVRRNVLEKFCIKK